MRDTLAELADRYGDDDEERAAMLEATLSAVRRRLERGGKRCPSCDELRPMSSFGKSLDRPDGLAHRCRSCERARIAALRERVPHSGPTPLLGEDST